MSKELQEFSLLFDLTPSISILNVTQYRDEITQTLEDIVSSYEGSVSLIDNDPPLGKLRMLAKQSSCDYVVMCNSILNHSDQNNLMKIISKALRDSGYIIILEEKGQSLSTIYSLLEEFDYGAISSIDIFEKYNLIMGKKLHMWGMD